jgi:hypothetical protein
MGLPVLLINIVHIVGGYKRYSKFIRKFKLVRPYGLLIVETVILKFKVEVLLSEDLSESDGFLAAPL